MADSVKFYICETCGNIVAKMHDSGVPIVCCGKPMKELVANTTDAATEKHVPVAKLEGDKLTVEVGSTHHPMLPEHFIQWVYVHTEHGGQRKVFKPGDEPVAEFTFTGDKPLEVYEYCNLHGLWMTKL